MSDISIYLDNIIFQNFEVPEQVAFGGIQRLITHEFIGGSRSVDVLGAQPGPIRFSGVLSGINAINRAQALDTLRLSGKPINLGWQSFFYSVVITELRLNYEKPWWIPFSIECTVVLEPLVSTDTKILISNLINYDLNMVSVYENQVELSSEPVVIASVSLFQSLVLAKLNTLKPQILESNSAINTAKYGRSGISAITQLVSTSEIIANVCAMSGYINRAAANIALEAL